MLRIAVLTPVVALVVAAAPVAAADPTEARLALRTAEALYADIRTTQLANGLRVYLKPIRGSTAVTTMVVYKVGSGDEDKTVTGLSHYLEHLMFKGTVQLKPGDIDRLTFRAGGSNNAYTSTDLTAYHFTMPAGRWQEALAVEADRMRNLRVDRAHEFDKEKGAVINELTGNEDRPWELESKALLPLLFGSKHPYGHPVIGEEKHVRDATETVIKDYYDRWYYPNNAALVMVGGFDADEALKTIERLFGPLPAGKLPARKTVPAEPVKLPVRKEMASKFSVPRLLVAYPAAAAGDRDQAALAVLDGLLGRGKRSRLYRTMVEGAAVASSASSDYTPGRFGGWFGFYVDVLPGKDRPAAEKLLLEQVADLRDKPVSAGELHRVQQQLLAAAIFSREGTFGLANSIGEAVTVTSLDFARQYLPSLLAVTPTDVQRVAKKYLDAERSVTIWSVPPAKKTGLAAARRAAAESIGWPAPIGRRRRRSTWRKARARCCAERAGAGAVRGSPAADRAGARQSAPGRHLPERRPGAWRALTAAARRGDDARTGRARSPRRSRTLADSWR
ncbi:MAG: pitrilysin family protein [Gemmataceae bacterium]